MNDSLSEEIKKALKEAKNIESVKAVEKHYVGTDGVLKQQLKALKTVSAEERASRGPVLQHIVQETNVLIKEKLAEFSNAKLEDALREQAEALPVHQIKLGHLHPITMAVNMMNEFFMNMGYSVYDAGEIETDEFNFERLNVPKDHPARDMQDTIYIQAPNILLRTQTSSIEARALSQLKPPFRIVCPGKVYRNEKANKSNHFIFHQYQAVVVQERVSIKDLLGTFTALFKKLYGPDVVVRYRSKYYPEVEPGVGLDMQCFNCHGSGCTVCKGVGWIEMGGSGIIHPHVLEQAGIDPTQWMGFAFGLGLDRWVMAKYNITDIRTLLGGDLAYKYFVNESALA